MDETQLSKSVKKLLKSHKSLQILEGGLKVKCSLTGHEMPCKAEAIEAYVGGKRYQRVSSASPKLDPAVYSQFLIPSNRPQHERQLFCKITCRHLNNLPHHIAQHVNGKRFQKAYARWAECQKSGEVFKPIVGRQKQRLDAEPGADKPGRKRGGKNDSNEEIIEDEDADEDDDDDLDSLSDLYPVDYFDKLDIATNAEQMDDSDDDDDAAKASANHVDGASKSPNHRPVNGGSSNLKRKMEKKKKPAVLKTVKVKKAKQ